MLPNNSQIGPSVLPLASQSQTTKPNPETMQPATESAIKPTINYGPKPTPPNLKPSSQMPRSSKLFDPMPTTSKIPMPKLNPGRNLNKYNKNYHPLSEFDIINTYYRMR